MKANVVQIQVRTTAENREWLKQTAEQQERSVNWMINKIVGEARVAAQAQANAPQ
jgi:uncharacterized protein (DUF1778 family)